MPDRDGVTLESPFVGPGMRGHGAAALLPLPAVAGARAAGQRPAAGRRAGADVGAIGRHRVARYRGERAARGDRGRPGSRRAGRRAAQPPRPVHLRGFGAALRRHRLRDRGGGAAAVAAAAARDRRRPPSSATGWPRSSATARRCRLGIGAVPDAVLAGLHDRRGLAVWSEMFSDGVLGLAKAGALDPGQPVHRVVRVRQRRPVRLAGPQPGRADAADRDGERPGADRAPAADGLGQRRAPGRPARAGQRDVGRCGRNSGRPDGNSGLVSSLTGRRPGPATPAASRVSRHRGQPNRGGARRRTWRRGRRGCAARCACLPAGCPFRCRSPGR